MFVFAAECKVIRTGEYDYSTALHPPLLVLLDRSSNRGIGESRPWSCSCVDINSQVLLQPPDVALNSQIPKTNLVAVQLDIVADKGMH